MPLSECTRACASLSGVLKAISGAVPSGYVVGGFVRDAVLGRIPRDIDVVTHGDPFSAAERVARELGASYFPLNEEHCIARVVQTPRPHDQAEASPPGQDHLAIDFARLDGTIEEDLARRDFTIDAMAIRLDDAVSRCGESTLACDDMPGIVIDPLGGLEDISCGRVRAGSERVFREDPGRLLRGVRLARELGFFIEAQTEVAIKGDARLVRRVAAERTREELVKIVAMPGASESLRLLDRLGLLTEVFPELEDCRDVEQPTCHFWDVLEHSLQTVATFEFITGQCDWNHGNDEMLDCLPTGEAHDLYLAAPVSSDTSRATLIKIASLLHDIAKPRTKSLDDTGRARFLGHATEGAAVAKAMLQRLRFSAHEASFVETLVCHHLRPAQMSTEGMPTRRAVYRFFRDTGHAGVGVLYLAMADYLACRGRLFTMAEWHAVCQLVGFILDERTRQENAVAPPKLLDGHELMRALNLQPGPSVGVLLEAVREAQAAGVITTRDDAFALARKMLDDRHFTVRSAK